MGATISVRRAPVSGVERLGHRVPRIGHHHRAGINPLEGQARSGEGRGDQPAAEQFARGGDPVALGRRGRRRRGDGPDEDVEFRELGQ